MQYALLIYSRPGAAEALSPDEREANHREYLVCRAGNLCYISCQ
jgi:hypothetical protein